MLQHPGLEWWVAFLRLQAGLQLRRHVHLAGLVPDQALALVARPAWAVSAKQAGAMPAHTWSQCND